MLPRVLPPGYQAAERRAMSRLRCRGRYPLPAAEPPLRRSPSRAKARPAERAGASPPAPLRARVPTRSSPAT